MQEILGSHNDDAAFAAFLADWQAILDARIAQAVEAIGAVEGLDGLILAGSHGAGGAWPLSDIDLIPIYGAWQEEHAVAAVQTLRLSHLNEWATQGWRTGLDIGRLRFTDVEINAAFDAGDPDPVPLLRDERWYYTIDKAWNGRALIDRSGRVAALSAWFTRHRFDPAVVAMRLHYCAEAAQTCLDEIDHRLVAHRRDLAFASFLKAVQWHQIRLMETWGERDNSLGRFGTRFERTASAHDNGKLVDDLNRISGLDEASVRLRLDAAPRWVIERRDRSWAARQHIEEDVSDIQNDRDALRVSSMYGLRELTGPPFPFWLGIPETDADLQDRARRLSSYLETP